MEDTNDLGFIVETDETVDTTVQEKVEVFLKAVRAIKLGEGDKFWKLIGTLPLANGKCSLSNTKTKVIKYLNKKRW
jgi:hypothetical protein